MYNYVRSISKDADGFVWVATNRGLSRFDGYSFKNYTKNGLISPWIAYLLKDKTGRLLITTEDGICYYDKIDDDFKYISKKNELKAFGTAPIFEDSQSNIWVAAENGLFKVENNQLFPTKIQQINVPHTIFEDKKNRLWIGSNDGLVVFDRKTNTNQLFPLASSSWKYFVYAIFPENDHQIWLGTDAGLLLFDTEKYTFEQLSEPEVKNKNIVINAITNFNTTNQYLTCGTANHGILIFDRKNKTFSKQIAASLFESNGLQTNTINTFFEENQRLWVGSNLGLYQINLLNQQFQTVKLKEFYERKSLDQLTRIIEDQANKKFWWIATNDERGRLLYYDSENKKIVRFYQIVSENLIKNLVNTTIRDLIFDKKGRLWIATFDGIYLMQNTGFKHFSLDKSRNLDAYVLKFDKNHKLWIGTEDGLSVMDINHFKIEKHPIKFGNRSSEITYDSRLFPIETFDIDSQNNIWIGNHYGCFYYNPVTKTNIRYFIKNHKYSVNLNRVTSIIINNQQLTYSTLAGLVKLDLQTLQTKIYSPEKGFYIYSLVSDKHQNLWMSTYKGIFKIDKKTQKFSFFSTQDGLYNDFSIYRINQLSEKFILGYNGAFSFFDPLAISLCNTTLKPQISEVFIGKQQQRIFNKNTDYQQIKVDHKTNNLTIKFTAVDYCNPEKIQFRYKLEGLENNWILGDKNRQVSYTNLDYKTYNFRLQVANEFGEWVTKEANMSIDVIAPFYLTRWFILLTISALCGLAYAFYRYRINQIIKFQLIRNRIAADLHDEVGSTLSSISIMSEMAAYKKDNSREKLLEISNNAREMIEKMDDIVWAINPQNDAFYNLESRMKNFAIPLFEAKDIAFKMSFPTLFEHQKLNMENRRNMYLIFKEAINNLVKYSACQNAEIICKIEHNLLILRILDDGIGFDLNEKTERNGIRNMKERAKKLGGEILIVSKKDEGTQIELRTSFK